MRPRVTVVVWVLVAATASPVRAQTCQGATPVVNKPGFRPNTTMTFALVESPSGQPFPADAVPCVWRAFQAWSVANAETMLGVRFVPGSGGIRVRFDDADGLLPDRVAGGWTDGERDADGALVGATIWLSPDRRLMDSCAAVTKAVLHELGHLHGLGDHRGPPGSTVMNDFAYKNDRGGRVAISPSACDAVQAARASAVLSAAVVALVTLGRPSVAGLALADAELRRR